MLKELGWTRVMGTLAQPCDAHAVEHAARLLQQDDIVIAIDACLGKPTSVGGFLLSEEALQPGKAIGRRLPPVGQYSIAGVVNSSGPKAYWKLQTTSLYLVLQMAKEAAEAINTAWSMHMERPEAGNQSKIRIV
ncbi:hypothetical protein D3C78_1034330 [compost metagenome]